MSSEKCYVCGCRIFPESYGRRGAIYRCPCGNKWGHKDQDRGSSYDFGTKVAICAGNIVDHAVRGIIPGGRFSSILLGIGAYVGVKKLTNRLASLLDS